MPDHLFEWTKIDPDGPGLHLPKREGDVGWDMEASEDVTISPGEVKDVPSNIRLSLPPTMWAEIKARSSSVRRGLQVDSNVIDTGYRGPLFAQVRNMKTPSAVDIRNAVFQGAQSHIWRQRWIKQHTIQVKTGERVAQVVFHLVVPNLIGRHIDEITDDTARGKAGFGSTGF